MPFIEAKIVAVSANPKDYFKQEANRGDPEFVVSSSMLKEFSHCPSRWKAGYEPPESDAKLYGSLLDCRLLTPDQFDQRYAVKPATYKDAKTGEEKPWNGNSNVCKAWLDEHSDVEVVSRSEVEDADAAIKRLMEDEIIRSWHESCQKQVWVSGLWKDERTGLVIPARCLIDYVPRTDSEFHKSAGDLKTTRSAALGPFQRWCYSAGYHVQGAFDLALLQAATGGERLDWCLILSENFYPWQVGRRLLSQDLLAMGRQTFELALRKYAWCLKTGKWPGYDDSNPDRIQGWSIVDAAPYMAYEAMSANMEPLPQEEDDLPLEDVVP